MNIHLIPFNVGWWLAVKECSGRPHSRRGVELGMTLRGASIHFSHPFASRTNDCRSLNIFFRPMPPPQQDYPVQRPQGHQEQACREGREAVWSILKPSLHKP